MFDSAEAARSGEPLKTFVDATLSPSVVIKRITTPCTDAARARGGYNGTTAPVTIGRSVLADDVAAKAKKSKHNPRRLSPN
jgi:hypothetical protein